jgi:hypothetical protein
MLRASADYGDFGAYFHTGANIVPQVLENLELWPESYEFANIRQPHDSPYSDQRSFLSTSARSSIQQEYTSAPTYQALAPNSQQQYTGPTDSGFAPPINWNFGDIQAEQRRQEAAPRQSLFQIYDTLNMPGQEQSPQQVYDRNCQLHLHEQLENPHQQQQDEQYSLNTSVPCWPAPTDADFQRSRILFPWAITNTEHSVASLDYVEDSCLFGDENNVMTRFNNRPLAQSEIQRVRANLSNGCDMFPIDIERDGRNGDQIAALGSLFDGLDLHRSMGMKMDMM